MSEIKLDVPDEILAALRGTAESAVAEVRLAAGVKLYEVGRLSSGAAATLAGIPRTLFLAKLADYGVAAFTQAEEELRRDFERA